MQPIRTAICSFGMSGRLFHAPFIHANPAFEYYAVLERTKDEARTIYPNVKVFRSLEEMLADPMIELVIVNTPNVTHHSFTKAAITAGKHVITEKPFTVSVEEGEELIALAKEKNVLLSVYHNRRYDSDFQTTKQIINEGSLGSIVDVEFHFDRYRLELSAKQHKETAVDGTGALYDLGSHLVDHALDLFGMPEAVYADIRIIRPGSQVDDRFDLFLYYPGKRVRLKGSYIAKEPVPSFIVHGMKGSFLKTAADVQESDLLKGKIPGSADWGREDKMQEGILHITHNGDMIREQVPTMQGNYMIYYDQIAAALRNNGPLPVTAEEGLNVIRVIRAAITSNEKKRLVSVTRGS